MRTGRVPLAALLLVLAFPVLQVSCTNDLYWEGEDYGSNEFLEVKQEDSTALDSHKRHKRDWNWGLLWPAPNESEAETVTTAVPDDASSYDKDDTDLDVGSGVPDKTESDPKEKTLRVTFAVMEPYRPAYSNRDSPEFLNISRSLANAVDLLFEGLPGTQRSSLVRIQSLVSDDFLCKVTLDIVTTRNEDTDTIKEILRNHIKNKGRLGEIDVRDGEFSAQLIDPGTTFECDFTEFWCDEGSCLPLSMKCNGRADCRDGTDEIDCPVPDTSNEPPTTDTTTVEYNENIDVNNAPTPDYRNYDQTPENTNYNQSLESPYEPSPEWQNPSDPTAGRDSNPYPYDPNVYRDITNPNAQNVRPENQDPYGQNTRPENQDPYGQNTRPENQDPYGQNTRPENQDPYGQNTRPENQDPYGQNTRPENQDPYGQNTRPENQDPYGQNTRPENQDPYGQNTRPENQDPYGQNTRPENQDPYGQNTRPDNRDPYAQSPRPDNRDPYDQSSSPDNWDNIFGQSTRPDNGDPGQSGNPEDRRENPDDRNQDTGTSEASSPSYGQESGSYPRGDLGGANDPYSTDTPDEPETVTGTTYGEEITTTRIYNECPPNYTRCDETRCVEQTRRCDGRNDCYDGTDEANCPSRKYNFL